MSMFQKYKHMISYRTLFSFRFSCASDIIIYQTWDKDNRDYSVSH